MDVFAVHEEVIADYRAFTFGFMEVRDARIKAFVDEQFAEGVQWPGPWAPVDCLRPKALAVARRQRGVADARARRRGHSDVRGRRRQVVLGPAGKQDPQQPAPSAHGWGRCSGTGLRRLPRPHDGRPVATRRSGPTRPGPARARRAGPLRARPRRGCPQRAARSPVSRQTTDRDSLPRLASGSSSNPSPGCSSGRRTPSPSPGAHSCPHHAGSSWARKAAG